MDGCFKVFLEDSEIPIMIIKVTALCIAQYKFYMLYNFSITYKIQDIFRYFYNPVLQILQFYILTDNINMLDYHINTLFLIII